MATPALSSEDLDRYAAQMTQIKHRIDGVNYFLGGPAPLLRVESGLLQLRLALEALALSSLITHRGEVAKVAAAFAKKGHAEALKLVRDLNPDFWPRPCVQVLDEQGRPTRWDSVQSGFLTESEYGRSWGELSAWLHASNPYSEERSLEAGVAQGLEIKARLVRLLNHHQVRLLDREELLVCLMHSREAGAVQATRWERIVG